MPVIEEEPIALVRGDDLHSGAIEDCAPWGEPYGVECVHNLLHVLGDDNGDIAAGEAHGNRDRVAGYQWSFGVDVVPIERVGEVRGACLRRCRHSRRRVRRGF